MATENEFSAGPKHAQLHDVGGSDPVLGIAPGAHAVTHETGGTDLVTLSQISGPAVAPGTGTVEVIAGDVPGTWDLHIILPVGSQDGFFIEDKGSGGVQISSKANVSVLCPDGNFALLAQVGGVTIGQPVGDSSKIGFFGGPPEAQPTITGALSTVADAPAKAVLTSIIAALKTLTGVNLVIDGTT